MPKPRQAQKKKDGTTATPKPVCTMHNEPVIMKRLYDRDNGFRPCGWRCTVEGCKKVILD